MYEICTLYGVVEGSKVRRRAKSVSDAIKAPKSVPNKPQNAFSTPRGRDVLLYPDRATFYNPVELGGSIIPSMEVRPSWAYRSWRC